MQLDLQIMQLMRMVTLKRTNGDNMSYKNFFGVSLLELVIVMCIFTIVSAGVVSLSVKTVEHGNNQRTVTSQSHLLNEIQEDIRNDLRNAFAVSISDGSTNVASCPNNYYVLQSCSIAAPSNVRGSTLDIAKLDDYDPVAKTSTFSFVRYQFLSYSYSGKNRELQLLNARPPAGKTALLSMVRFERNIAAKAGTPGTFWPKKINSPNNAGCVDPGYSTAAGTPFDITALAPKDKVYNNITYTNQVIAITGQTNSTNSDEAFEGVYGDKWDPPLGSVFTDCSYYLKNINLHGLTLTDQSMDTKYDAAYLGKITLAAPEMSFEVNTSMKFF